MVAWCQAVRTRVWRWSCACVCYGATGRRRGTRTGHACGDANDTTEPHTIAYTSYSINHIMPARKLVCVLRVCTGVAGGRGTRAQRGRATDTAEPR
eukprot:4891373-Prymnesium_polylepis.1